MNTQFKKFISLILSVLLTLSCTVFSVSAVENFDSLSLSFDKSFKVTVTSNVAETVSQTYSDVDKTMTVTLYLKTGKKLLNGDWYITYDTSILSLNKDADPYPIQTPILSSKGGSYAVADRWPGIAYGNFMSEKLYDFTQGELTDNVFLTATFDIIGDYTQDTTVDLSFDMLSGGVYVQVSETEARVDVYNYIDTYELSDLFKAESERLITLSEPEPEPTEPPTTEPETTEPTEPQTTEPVSTEPTEPPTTEPVSTEPTEPPTTEPVSTEPTEMPTTEPETTEPTEPPTTEPETTEPTEPPTTEPVTTEPVTTEPTEPSTTEPNTTEPTEPPTIEPTDPTTPVEKLPGDVNGDGEVNIKDAAAIQLKLARLYTYSFDESVADVNNDGEINIKDAAYLQLKLAKLL